MDRRWLTLQRSVAAAMILLFAGVMAGIQQTLIPPLAVAGLLFAVPLGLTGTWPRASAIGIGAVSTVWLLLQVVNWQQVAPDLARPDVTILFTPTVAMSFGSAGWRHRAGGCAATSVRPHRVRRPRGCGGAAWYRAARQTIAAAVA